MTELYYQKLNASHTSDLLSMWADKDVIRFTNIKKACTAEELMDKIQTLQQFDVFVVSDAAGFVGIVGCPCIDKQKAHYGVFYHFSSAHWGQGYASMATGWLLGFMKQQYPSPVFFATVVVENSASEKILRRLGFTCSSEEQGCEYKGGKGNMRHFSLEG